MIVAVKVKQRIHINVFHDVTSLMGEAVDKNRQENKQAEKKTGWKKIIKTGCKNSKGSCRWDSLPKKEVAGWFFTKSFY